MLVVFSTAVVLIVSLMARLFYLMVFDAEHYQKLAKDLHERERKIKAARGEILDRNGVVLAANKIGLYDLRDPQPGDRTGKSSQDPCRRTGNG